MKKKIKIKTVSRNKNKNLIGPILKLKIFVTWRKLAYIIKKNLLKTENPEDLNKISYWVAKIAI